MKTDSVPDFASWIGRFEQSTSTIALPPATALAATLDHARRPEIGDPLPPLWHWIYFTPQSLQSELGVDGHPRRGGFLPPIPLPRRMWAGGRLKFLKPLRIGDEVTRTSTILHIEAKTGRQGPLVFVTLAHKLYVRESVRLEEEQDLVYRAPDSGKADPVAVAQPLVQPQWRDEKLPDPALLFRYSALTFNAHRIHYDLPYAIEEEGYPGLVVQGPLVATLLADRLLAHCPGRLTAFDFRGVRPLIAGRAAQFCGDPEGADGRFSLWAEDDAGNATMKASAQIEIDHAD